MKSAPAKETQLLFDMFGEEPVAEVKPAPAPIAEVKAPEAAAEIPAEWQVPQEDAPRIFPIYGRCVLPAWPRDVAGDPLARLYEIGSSFVHLAGERSGKGWRASLLVTVADSFEMGEPFAMSAIHKTLGDAFGSVRHHAMEKLRADAARIHGSFPPPKGSEPDDATALYWALGREDFRELADPEETIAAVAPVAVPSITELAPEVAPVAEEIAHPAPEMIVGYDPGDPAGSQTIELLDWRIPGALARVRIFHPRPDTGETWTWNVEWSTGSSSEVEGVLPAESRKDCITRGRSRLTETFAEIATRGEAYTSRKAEYDRTCALYRLILSSTPLAPQAGGETMKEAA